MSEIERSGSPFDAIRREDERGEFWSARELMPLLEYRKWERFEDAVERAKMAAQNAHHDADQHFSRRREALGKTQQIGAEYRLTRFGAYLIAMNGDPRKKAIAEAQTYFAVKTREAEIGEIAEISESRPSEALIRLEDLPPPALRALADEREQRIKAERALAKALPMASAYQDLFAKDGALELVEVALVLAPITGGLGRTGLVRELRAMRIFQQAKPIPYQRHSSHFAVKADAHGRKVGSTTVVPVHGLAWLRAKFIKRRFPQDGLFEIGGGGS